MRQADSFASIHDDHHGSAGNYNGFVWWRRWFSSKKDRKERPEVANLNHPGGSGGVEMKQQRRKNEADSATISIEYGLFKFALLVFADNRRI